MKYFNEDIFRLVSFHILFDCLVSICAVTSDCQTVLYFSLKPIKNCEVGIVLSLTVCDLCIARKSVVMSDDCILSYQFQCWPLIEHARL